MKKIYYYQTSIGTIALTETGGFINDLFLQAPKAHNCIEQQSDVLLEGYQQICQYLAGQRHEFDLPLKPLGTDFQCRVWLALQEIPFGQTRSYKQIAEQLNKPKAYRAIGNANGKNPIPIIIPCHRVINSGGGLGGYSLGLGVKKMLLKLEGTAMEV